MTMQQITTPQTDKTRQLTDAFKLFNQLSEDLAQAYQGLEAQVTRLNQELTAARSARLQTLMEKEKLATRLQQILAALPAAVVVLDKQRIVIDCNQLAIDYLGEPLIGLAWDDVLQRRLFPVTDCPQERSLADGRRLSITCNSLGDEAEQIVLLSDISELRSLQDLLAQQQQLSAMGEMVARMAHQVRTPLSTAILYASHLKKTQLPEQQRQQFAGKIMERLQYLERQVNDMLIFAKQGKMTMESFPIRHLLAQLQDSKAGMHCKLIIDDQSGLECMCGNEDALLGALINLVNNAEEACDTDSVIKISLRCPASGGLSITIQDDGPGIDPAVQQRIFEPFYTTKASGTGLGLAVVNSVVKAHDGHLMCHSEPGKGTRFVLELPCAEVRTVSLSSLENEEAQHEAA